MTNEKAISYYLANNIMLTLTLERITGVKITRKVVLRSISQSTVEISSWFSLTLSAIYAHNDGGTAFSIIFTFAKKNQFSVNTPRTRNRGHFDP